MAEPRGGDVRVSLVSGGQTGVDRAALEVGRELGLPVGGWCPAGGWAEDLPAPPGVLVRFPELHPTPTADPAQRTLWNVRDSGATLVLVPRPGWVSAGTRLTVEAAEREGRACLVCEVTGSAAAAAARVVPWLESLLARRTALVLNVAGPRESEAPGIGRASAAVLRHALRPFVTLR